MLTRARQNKKNSLHLEKFRINFDFTRLIKVNKELDRHARYTKILDAKKKDRLIEKLAIGEKVLVLAQRLQNKMHLEDFVRVQLKTNHFF